MNRSADKKSSTPSANSFYFDGDNVPFQTGQSVMQAALAAGMYIPHLCFHPRLSAHGSCRLCLVAIDGRYHCACTTPARANTRVESDTLDIQKMRLQLIEMLFAEADHFCPSCELSGNCQLQALAYDLGMTHSDFPLQYPNRAKDGSHADIYVDRDRCINCELCVRAGYELDQKNVFSFGGRGQTAYLQINSNDERLASTNLTRQDHSVRVCPVGAIVHKDSSYQERANERFYDANAISQVGNKRPAVVSSGYEEASRDGESDRD